MKWSSWDCGVVGVVVVSSKIWWENHGCQPKLGRMRGDCLGFAVSLRLWAVCATRSWSWALVAITVRVVAFIEGICATAAIVSVGWQCASYMPSSQGNASWGWVSERIMV